MNFPYSKHQVSRAGERVASSSKKGEAIEDFAIIGAWRAIHGEPLKEMLEVVSEVAKDFPGAYVAGRLKRVETIIEKLRRPGFTHDLKTLDDIAGCRLVLPEFSDITSAVQTLEAQPGFWRKKDYISEPKKDGYRGVHTLHRCDAVQAGVSCLRVEVQVRSSLQHAWSTAVESYDLRPGPKMKFGGGTEAEKRFFLLVSELFAQVEVGNLKDGLDLNDIQVKIAELKRIESSVHIISWLEGFSRSVSFIQSTEDLADSHAFLITFNYDSQFITIRPFGSEEMNQAPSDYSRAEEDAEDNEVILLVQANSLEEIQAAYPNYFSDISLFLNQLKEILSVGS